MSASDTLVALLSQVVPREKVYPEAVPAGVLLPFVRYTESSRPAPTYDGSGGDTLTATVTVCAATKADAARLADRIAAALDGAAAGGYRFYFCGPREYTYYWQERISGYDLTFTIL